MTKEELKISWDLESNIYNEMLNYLISLELKESELIHFTKLLGNYIEVIR